MKNPEYPGTTFWSEMTIQQGNITEIRDSGVRVKGYTSYSTYSSKELAFWKSLGYTYELQILVRKLHKPIN